MSNQGTVPVTSGTYNFAPSLGETVLYAYGLCGIRRTELVQAHFEDARMAAQLMTSRWSAKGVNLWQVDQQTVQLQQSVSTYNVPPNTIAMLDSYIGFGQPEIDRLILPISRTEYASYPNKTQTGFPTTYWFDRLLCPKVTLWPVPDGTVSTFKYYRLRQNQDATLQGGAGLEMPVYFLEAAAYGIAYRVAYSWAPDKVATLKQEAIEAYNDAVNQNVETSNVYISPQVGGYYR